MTGMSKIFQNTFLELMFALQEVSLTYITGGSP